MKSGFRFGLAACAILLALLIGTATHAEAALSGRFMIRQAQSSLVVTGGWLPNQTYGNGSPVIIFQNENGENSRYWRIEPVGGDQYRVMWRNTNLALDLARGERRNGVEILLWQWNGGANQKWYIVNGPHGAVFINVQTGLALDLRADSRTPRTRYQGYTPNNTRAQGFDLIRLGGGSSSSYSGSSSKSSSAYSSAYSSAKAAPDASSGRRLVFSKVRVKLTLPNGWRYTETPATKDSAATLELYAPGDQAAVTITTGFNTDERAADIAQQMSKEMKGTSPRKANSASWTFETSSGGVKTLVIVTEDRRARSVMVLTVTNDNDETETIINSMETY